MKVKKKPTRQKVGEDGQVESRAGTKILGAGKGLTFSINFNKLQVLYLV